MTPFELLHRNSPEGHVWGQGRLTKKQVCTRLGHICREEWSNTSKSSQRKAMHKWAGDKPKLDAGREQRSICSFSDDDPAQDQTQIWRSRRAAAMLCKGTTLANPNGSSLERPCASDWSKIDIPLLGSPLQRPTWTDQDRIVIIIIITIIKIVNSYSFNFCCNYNYNNSKLAWPE